MTPSQFTPSLDNSYARVAQALSNGELQLAFQPIFSASSHRVVAAEALLRWAHPTHGTLTPDSFLKHIENTDIELPICTLVFEKALQALTLWSAKGFNLRIAVNLSPALLRPELITVLSHLKDKYGQLLSSLELEITERYTLEDASCASKCVGQIQEKGLRVSLDDFGTGYNGWDILAKLNVDALKIDRAFVSQVENERGLEVVRAMTLLAQCLGLEIIAEGVEKESQLALLQGLKIHYWQGYLGSKPQSYDAFTSWLEDHRHGRTALHGQLNDTRDRAGGSSHLHSACTQTR
ncbi:EAL domain-containing protein [Chromobacterium haemolyticum]|uniref:EAL domain-containing protein n=1 Tax=Chromobacterium fluminis TaxID=3044269 RepID=A0ABX0KY82_9NEIS|nr:EAL domain-containing protein [Chromobacterium haemolyticum]NHR04509.1 EAL domain-containing protein [Chromobacterium haemolyticum]